MRKITASLALLFLMATEADLVTTLLCMAEGHVEQNPLYNMLGGNPFWALYVFLNLGLLILLIKAEQRWRWTSLILAIPIAVHTICAIHNIGLVM